MADLMSTGVSALLAFRRSLDVTGHNIANVGTAGYSRQRAELVTRGGQGVGDGYVGAGVRVSTVNRLYDDMLALQVRTTASGYGGLAEFTTHAERLSKLFADSETGLTAALQGFVNAAQAVADTPTSIPARQVLLSEARALAERLQYYDSRMRDTDAEIGAKLATEAMEVSTLAAGIARLNNEIANASAYGHAPNDLLDQRDRMLDELAGHISVNVVPASNGMVNVFVGKGQPLVLGGDAARLATQPDAYDPERSVLALQTDLGAVDVTDSLTGGSIGGLLDFRSQMLDPARNALGRMSAALVQVANAQHRAGMDLHGDLGGDLFAVGEVAVLARSSNAGSATIAVARGDTSALTSHDYLLARTGSGWELQRADTGAAVPLTGSGTAADPLRGAGLEIVVGGGAPAIGDRYLIRPTREAVDGLSVVIDEPERIAAAAPIRTAAVAANVGTGRISPGVVVDAADPQLRASVTIEFLSPSTYSVNGAGSFAYTPGAPITVNGWEVRIDGAPAVGDRFTVTNNAGGAGDNRNALLLAGVLGQPVLDGGTTSLDAAVTRFVGAIGVDTRQAQMNRDAQRVVHDDNLAARDSVSGVNLDEEAANLLRFQQAYQAAAQMIQVSSVLFDTLLGATRR